MSSSIIEIPVERTPEIVKNFLLVHAKDIKFTGDNSVPVLIEQLKTQVRNTEAKRYLQLFEEAEKTGKNPIDDLFANILFTLREHSFVNSTGDGFYQLVRNEKLMFASEILRWVTY